MLDTDEISKQMAQIAMVDDYPLCYTLDDGVSRNLVLLVRLRSNKCLNALRKISLLSPANV